MTITNTQATPVKSVSVRESTTANFISMMTSDTPHPAKVTQSFRYTTREVSSATSENVNPAISTVTTNPSTQEVTGIDYIDIIYLSFVFNAINKNLKNSSAISKSLIE